MPDEDEYPAHQVSISTFRMLSHEVTNAEYRHFDPDQHDTPDDRPAVGISWYDAMAYAAWLGGRLPTEAEWEYAARAACPHEYCDRNGKETELDKVGWYAGNSNGRLHPVKMLERNPWGIYDMYGNVWEWTLDWYGPYSAEAQTNPWGPSGGEGRVFRGGSFRNGARGARAAYRVRWRPGIGFGLQGFRVVFPVGPEQ